MRRIGYAARIIDRERDHRSAAAVCIDPADLAASPEYNGIAVRCPVHVRIDSRHRPGFLHVHVQLAIDHAFFAAGDVLDPQLALILVAPDKGDFLAVGRRCRAHRAAITIDRCGHFACRNIIALNGKDAAVRILRVDEGVPWRGVARVVDRAAIRRVDRLAQFLLQRFAGTLDQLHTAATRDMVHPDLARAERASGCEVLLRDDELSVRRPCRLVEQAEVFFRYLALVRAIGIHHPDIVCAPTVRREGDAAAIG